MFDMEKSDLFFVVQHIFLTSQKKRVERKGGFDAKRSVMNMRMMVFTHLELIGGGGGGNSDAMDDGSASLVFRDSRYWPIRAPFGNVP